MFQKRKYFKFCKRGIKILSTPQDKIYVKETYSGILKGIGVLKSYFELAIKLPTIEVTLAEDRKEYDSILQGVFGIKLKETTPPTRIAQIKGKHLLLLSPRAYKSDSVYTYKHDEYQSLMVHEVTHIIVRSISGGEDNVPRWFEEGLAVYLSRQWLFEEIRKPLLQRISMNEIPSFKKIIHSRDYYYYWGWTIINYIEKIYGKKLILQIIKRSKYQDTFEILGEKIRLIERKWKNDMKNFSIYM